MRTVRYIFPISHHYRLPFHENLRDLLLEKGIDYKPVYSDPPHENILKADTVEIEWGIKTKTVEVPIVGLKYQHAFRLALDSDLVIVQQENKLALNYFLQTFGRNLQTRVSFFGHGKNFQSRKQGGISERWKAYWLRKVDWWFAYTEETRLHLVKHGYPDDQITVFNNSVDTNSLRNTLRNLEKDYVKDVKDAINIRGDDIGIYVGGLYEDKRLDFLLQAAKLIKIRVPSFELLVVGGGPQYSRVKKLAENESWIHIVGPKFGKEKVALMQMSKIFMMPGLVGLAILDAFAVGLPVVTTAFPWHSPEIAYLEHGINGILVHEWEDAATYATTVAALMRDEERLKMMSDAAQRSADKYSVEEMANRFSQGVVAALGRAL